MEQNNEKVEINQVPCNAEENRESNSKEIKKDCPFTKIIKGFRRQFITFYCLRAVISLLKGVMKKKSKFSLSELLPLLFNFNNIRTGLFLSLMPALYKFLNFIFEHSKYFKSFNLDPKIFTFISGFVSSLIGILISEKANIMNFIIVSVFVRSVHSLIQVCLSRNNYKTKSKFTSYLAVWLACFGALFINFYFPKFKPISGLIDKYALYDGKMEEDEMKRLRELKRLDI